jgi:DNA-binding NtrC family response regulator
VISATHCDLLSLIQEGRFREDLYYRLAVIPVRLPSLRERPEDILLLAGHFLSRTAAGLGKVLEGFDDEATAWLLAHRWPGNVRELENVVERAATLARGARVTRADLGTEFASSAAGPGGGHRPTLQELEQQYIQRVLEETRGDKAWHPGCCLQASTRDEAARWLRAGGTVTRTRGSEPPRPIIETDKRGGR